MRLVGIRRIEEGSVLARDVYPGRGNVPLLTRSTVLDRRYLDALEQAGIHAVYVDDELGRGIEVSPVITEETRRTAGAALEHAFTLARNAYAAKEPLPDAAFNELTEIARLIADEIAAHGDAVVALQDLAAADGYTLQHSIDVTAAGLLVGRHYFREHGWIDFRGSRRFDRTEERLVQLGLGLMLHDIGKVVVPAEILSKPGPLDEAEWNIVRRHPRAGLDLLPASSSPLARTVIRSHHERWDGSGYPDGTAGTMIHPFARIAAIADTYDAVTSERPYKPARPPVDGWRVIVEGTGSAFDPEIVASFRRVVAPYPPGAEIVLADGRRGVVVSAPADALDTACVRIGWDAEGRPVDHYEIELDSLP